MFYFLDVFEMYNYVTWKVLKLDNCIRMSPTTKYIYFFLNFLFTINKK